MEGMNMRKSAGASMKGSARDMMKSSAADLDEAFAREMIAHHQMAITMSQRLLARSQDPVLTKLANRIIAAQQPEIDLLQRWLMAPR